MRSIHDCYFCGQCFTLFQLSRFTHLPCVSRLSSRRSLTAEHSALSSLIRSFTASQGKNACYSMIGTQVLEVLGLVYDVSGASSCVAPPTLSTGAFSPYLLLDSALKDPSANARDSTCTSTTHLCIHRATTRMDEAFLDGPAHTPPPALPLSLGAQCHPPYTYPKHLPSGGLFSLLVSRSFFHSLLLLRLPSLQAGISCVHSFPFLNLRLCTS